MPAGRRDGQTAGRLFYTAYLLYLIPQFWEYTTLTELGFFSKLISGMKQGAYLLFAPLCLFSLYQILRSSSWHTLAALLGLLLTAAYQAAEHGDMTALVAILIGAAFYGCLGYDRLDAFLKVNLYA